MPVYRLFLAVLAIIVVRSSTPCYRAPLYIVLSLFITLLRLLHCAPLRHCQDYEAKASCSVVPLYVPDFSFIYLHFYHFVNYFQEYQFLNHI